MYRPKHFQETRVDVLHDLMREYPLAALVVLTATGLEANHLPLEIDPRPAPFGTLRGHVARANPLWRNFSRDVDALAIFQGPNVYISPSWYPTKKPPGRSCRPGTMRWFTHTALCASSMIASGCVSSSSV